MKVNNPNIKSMIELEQRNLFKRGTDALHTLSKTDWRVSDEEAKRIQDLVIKNTKSF